MIIATSGQIHSYYNVMPLYRRASAPSHLEGPAARVHDEEGEADGGGDDNLLHAPGLHDADQAGQRHLRGTTGVARAGALNTRPITGLAGRPPRSPCATSRSPPGHSTAL